MKTKKLLFIFVATVALLVAVSSCYAKGPWRGKVIDAETKQPIEGAAVVAVWEREYAGPAGTTRNFFDAKETLTDKEGNFEISSFSALSIPLVRNIYGPRFTIFKPGYGSFPHYQVSPKKDLMNVFGGKGSIVELPRLKTEDERKKSVAWAYTNAPWEYTPELLKLINQEYKALGLEPVGPKGGIQ